MRIVFPQLTDQTAFSDHYFSLSLGLVHFLYQNDKFLGSSQALFADLVAGLEHQ